MKIISLETMPGLHFFRELEVAGLGGKASIREAAGRAELLVHDEVAEAAVMAVVAAHNPTPALFQEKPVTSAADVDQVTSQRVLDYLAPHWLRNERMQERHLLRALQDFARAQEIKRDPAGWAPADIAWADKAIADAKVKDAQCKAYRDEAAVFKASKGW